jgi:hypothetical protein
MKKLFLIILVLAIATTNLNAQAWSDWNKLGTGDVYCRIQKVPMANSSVYFEINIEYKINGNWIRSQSDENTSIDCANAYFVESNGGLRKNESTIYIKKEAPRDFYLFQGKMKMQTSQTKFFKARLVIQPLWKDYTSFEYKIPIN